MDAIPTTGCREPGIYLHLPAEEHHADLALGSTAHRKLKIHPVEFFASWAGNPEREPDKDTPAMRFGRAVHRLVLEGEAALEREFFCEPSGERVVRTMDDMKRLLRPMGFTATGNKEELIKTMRGALPGVAVYDDVVGEAERLGKVMLKPEEWRRVLLSGKHISAHPQLSRAFQGGRSEISVFWVNERGIRCKARFDYQRVVEVMGKAKPYLMAALADLKSFSAPQEVPIERQLDNAAAKNLLQCVHYLDGFKAMQQMLEADMVLGQQLKGKAFKPYIKDAKPEDFEFLDLVAKAQRARFHFVFYKSSGAVFADSTYHEPGDPLLTIAREQIRLNERRFREYYAVFGHDMWVSLNEPRHLRDESDIKPWLL